MKQTNNSILRNCVCGLIMVAALQAFGMNDEGRNWDQVEKDLNTAVTKEQAPGQAPVIKTSRPYQLHQLFTTPTAYALQPYGLRFGGEGNIHSTLANMSAAGMHASATVGLGGVAEIGYQLAEYNTVGEGVDNIMMGHFKLNVVKESPFLPAFAISAGQNLKEDFRDNRDKEYRMVRNAFDVVASKSFSLGNYHISVHPGVQMFNDELKSADYENLGGRTDQRVFNYRLGLSWQSQPSTIFMYETKVNNTMDVSALNTTGLSSHQALENNLGIRYYIRNWLCMDAGIRYLYDLETDDDDMRLHANFVGVIPLNTLYTRIENMFKH